jgi:site-specific recombinase XerD
LSIERPKNNTEHKITFLDKDEIGLLLQAVETSPLKINSARDAAIIKLALATGLRVSALVNINIEDIDWHNNELKVIEKRQKIRSIHIGDNLKQVLKDWITIRNEEFQGVDTTALFVSSQKQRISVDSVSYMLKQYCNKAGIKQITPHKLRASAACGLAKAGIPVKAIAKQLGHSNIGTTMRYIDAFDEDVEKSTNILDNLF